MYCLCFFLYCTIYIYIYIVWASRDSVFGCIVYVHFDRYCTVKIIMNDTSVLLIFSSILPSLSILVLVPTYFTKKKLFFNLSWYFFSQNTLS